MEWGMRGLKGKIVRSIDYVLSSTNKVHSEFRWLPMGAILKVKLILIMRGTQAEMHKHG